MIAIQNNITMEVIVVSTLDGYSMAEWTILDINTVDPNETNQKFNDSGVLEALPDLSYYYNRKISYPPIEEQLDYIYHNGVEAWKTNIIDPVKLQFPKP